MIELKNVTKTFGTFKALDGLTLTVPKGAVYGLVGPNGAGKSTAIRHITGVYRPDCGEVTLDGKAVYENTKVKETVGYIPDEIFYFPSATLEDMRKYYKGLYPKFDDALFEKIGSVFDLPRKSPIRKFSKGMKKQISLLVGICSNVKYLLCDETFDGLDPVMRQGIKSLLAQEMDERGLTPVIASHNLRELEDICDSIGLLHQGGVLLSKDMEQLKNERRLNYAKIRAYEKEVGTLRTVMQGYIRQIDSLNNINKKLTRENISYKKEISSAKLRAEMAEERAEELNNKVRAGAVIRARSITLKALNEKGKEITRVQKASRLYVDFALSANDLAEPGNRPVYVCITSPEGYLIANADAATFSFEGEQKVYSAMREVDYDCSDLGVCIYVNGNGFTAGTYHVEIYVDGRLAGANDIALR